MFLMIGAWLLTKEHTFPVLPPRLIQVCMNVNNARHYNGILEIKYLWTLYGDVATH
jgi:hypothetical protein